eukprot:13834096-Alexandrium_andersonii.AAC.1
MKCAPTWRAHPDFRLQPVQGSRLGGVGAYAIVCPAGCGAHITLASRPSEVLGEWPTVRRGSCGQTARAALA